VLVLVRGCGGRIWGANRSPRPTAYVRKVKTVSGATVVQIVEKRHGVRRIVALREVAHELRQMGTADAETASWTIAGMTNKSSGELMAIAAYALRAL
jgi:hypothetical protein